MNLCDEVYKGLELLNNNSVNDVKLKEILINLSQSFKKKNKNLDLNENERKILISIYCLFLEACRLNTSLKMEIKEIDLILKQISITESFKNLIINTYKNSSFRVDCKEKLNNIKLNCNRSIIENFENVTLTKDTIVKSTRKKNYKHICQTEYLLNIQTNSNSQNLLTCSIQNIEDMSIKLKECMKTIDRLFTVKKKNFEN